MWLVVVLSAAIATPIVWWAMCSRWRFGAIASGAACLSLAIAWLGERNARPLRDTPAIGEDLNSLIGNAIYLVPLVLVAIGLVIALVRLWDRRRPLRAVPKRGYPAAGEARSRRRAATA
jgi:hypothetical protein